MAANLANCFSTSLRKFCRVSCTFRNVASSSSLNVTPCLLGSVFNRLCVRSFHLTSGDRGVEEFFPPGILESNDPLPEEVKSGRSWRASELRQKSNEDLHKLWYVLLKERNILLTVQWEAKRQQVLMPSPERLHKVKKSMAMIKVVIGERRNAIEAIERRTREERSEENSLKGISGKQQETIINDKDVDRHSNQVPLTT